MYYNTFKTLKRTAKSLLPVRGLFCFLQRPSWLSRLPLPLPLLELLLPQGVCTGLQFSISGTGCVGSASAVRIQVSSCAAVRSHGCPTTIIDICLRFTRVYVCLLCGFV
jgi:hypothetical protein